MEIFPAAKKCFLRTFLSRAEPCSQSSYRGKPRAPSHIWERRCQQLLGGHWLREWPRTIALTQGKTVEPNNPPFKDFPIQTFTMANWKALQRQDCGGPNVRSPSCGDLRGGHFHNFEKQRQNREAGSTCIFIHCSLTQEKVLIMLVLTVKEKTLSLIVILFAHILIFHTAWNKEKGFLGEPVNMTLCLNPGLKARSPPTWFHL